MDKFLGLDLKAKCARHITAHQRQSEFSHWTHVSGSKLFCTPCNKVLDHVRKSSVDSHRKSAEHKSKEERMKRMLATDVEEREAVKKQKVSSVAPFTSKLSINFILSGYCSITLLNYMKADAIIIIIIIIRPIIIIIIIIIINLCYHWTCSSYEMQTRTSATITDFWLQ